jgi:4-amino-4-deoxy-L-arabinose transferase-like glycosyltransferase
MKKLLFVLLFAIIILPRFVFLNNVPAAINEDELHYTLNTKSFVLTGKDILRKTSPLDILLFKYPAGETIQAELPYFLEMPIFGSSYGFSLAGLALPNAVFGVLTVGLIFLITKKLFDEQTALLTSFVASINPWLIFISRTSYEAGLAIPLFLAILYLLLVAKGWKILLIVPVALLAFYSYIGTKLIFLPLMMIGIAYAYFYINKRKFLKQYSILFILSLLLTVFFFFQILHNPSSRTSEILTPNSPKILEQMHYMRTMTIRNPLMNISENNYYIYLTVLAKNTFNAFSPFYLFAGADYFYLIGIHGLFYYLDVIFLGLGALLIFNKNRRLLVFLGALALLSALPEVFHNPDGNGVFTPHVALLVPILLIMIGFGLNKFLCFSKNKYKYIFLSIIILGYTILFINFVNAYFFRFPLQEGTFEMQNRTLSKYLSLIKDTKGPIDVYASSPKTAFKEFLFYSNNYNSSTVRELNKSLTDNNLTYKNISFMGCSDRPAIPQKNLIIDSIMCNRKQDGALSIVQLSDSGARYYIYNDRLCSKYKLPQFITGLKLADLNIESMSEQQFCQKFIVKY